MSGLNEVVDSVMGKEEEQVEELVAADEQVAAAAAEPAKAEEAKPAEGLEKPADEAAEGEQAKPAEGAEVDVENLLKEVETKSTTAPGGAPAGVIRDLQEERRARHEAEARAIALENRIAALETSRTATAATGKTCSLEEALEKGEIQHDDVVTAAQQALWNKNARERDVVEKARTEQEGKRTVVQLQEVAALQESQVAATLSPEKVGKERSYSNVVGMGRHFLTQKDAEEIAAIIQRGGNGAAEMYRRCQSAIVTAYPSLKEVFTGKPKTNVPGAKPENKPEPGKETITQEQILAAPGDPATAKRLMMGD